MRLLALGALSAAMLPLTGCLFGGIGRDMLALRLLSEKYDRKFRIVEKTYYYNTASIPEVYCSAENEDDLVFSLEFDVYEEKIVRDTYVGRKLGRQVENIITECLSEQGILSVSHSVVIATIQGDILVNDIEPDLSLDDFLNKYGGFKTLTTIVITDEADNPRTSPQFANAIRMIYKLLGEPESQMSVLIVEKESFAEYSDYFHSVSSFYTPVMIMDNQPVDGILAGVKDSEVIISESSFWR